LRNVTSHKVLLNLLISKRIQMKYSERLKFLDSELSQFYANFTFPTQKSMTSFMDSPNVWYINHMFQKSSSSTPLG